MPENIQERIKKILGDHFEPLLKPEWHGEISIYDIGARGQNCFDEVIVWLRSYKLQDHTQQLMVPSSAMMMVDPVDRAGVGDGRPRIRGDTVIVRLFKPVETEADGSVDLLVELFQVFPDEDEAEGCYDILLHSTCRINSFN